MKKHIIDLLNKNDITELTIADVGAKGSVEFIEELSGITTIHAFEPNPVECNNLKILYKDYPFKTFHLNELGLAENSGVATFYLTNHNSMSSFLKPDIENYEKHFGSYNEFTSWKSNIDTQETISINIQKADEYFNDKDVDYLKLDTQGSELSILKGAKKLIQNKKIHVIKVEVSTIPIYKDQALFSDIDLFLRENHYELIDFITYRNENTSLLNRGQVHAHYAPCGDAIYVLIDNEALKSCNIKKGIFLYWLGYTSIANFFFEKAALSVDDINTLKSIKTSNHKSFYLRLLKNIIPPVLFKLMKRIK
jgi:FkbM family methyltransferase